MCLEKFFALSNNQFKFHLHELILLSRKKCTLKTWTFDTFYRRTVHSLLNFFTIKSSLPHAPHNTTLKKATKLQNGKVFFRIFYIDTKENTFIQKENRVYYLSNELIIIKCHRSVSIKNCQSAIFWISNCIIKMHKRNIRRRKIELRRRRRRRKN